MTVNGWPSVLARAAEVSLRYGHQFFLDLLQNVKRNSRVLELF